ncbi:MAG: DinB family protein, partial [Bryobacteraceae bacterium]
MMPAHTTVNWTDPAAARAALGDSRRRSLGLLEDLSDAQLRVPLLSLINPPLWELGHVAWFQEKWILRHALGRPAIRDDADALYDSSAVDHDTRWNLPLPTRAETFDYARKALDRALDAAGRDEAAYFVWLAAMHEDMHGEAFTYTRQTMGWPARVEDCPPAVEPPPPGDVALAGGEFGLGAERGQRFVFDNEKGEHRVR